MVCASFSSLGSCRLETTLSSTDSGSRRYPPSPCRMVTPRSSCAKIAAQISSDLALMIFTSVRVVPSMSTLSSTTV